MAVESELIERSSEEKRSSVSPSEASEPVETRPRYERKYVYCIIPLNGSQLRFGNIGIGGAEVYTIDYGGIAAVVSDSPVEEYVLTEENIGAHNEVVTKVMAGHTTVPMAFGMVFKNEDILGAVLKKLRAEIKSAFRVVDSKVELGLKVIRAEGAELDEEAFAADIKELRKAADQTKLGRRFSKRLALNAFYLVAKEKVGAFSDAVEILQQKYPQLRIQYSGPWPPYNFVKIEVGRE